MDIWQIEKLGGLANFGGARSRLRSRGQLDPSTLPTDERKRIEALFRKSAKSAGAARSPAADAFRYRITRTTPSGPETIELPESIVPAALAGCVKDELI